MSSFQLVTEEKPSTSSRDMKESIRGVAALSANTSDPLDFCVVVCYPMPRPEKAGLNVDGGFCCWGFVCPFHFKGLDPISWSEKPGAWLLVVFEEKCAVIMRSREHLTILSPATFLRDEDLQSL